MEEIFPYMKGGVESMNITLMIKTWYEEINFT
jgi:hypothetical protein